MNCRHHEVGWIDEDHWECLNKECDVRFVEASKLVEADKDLADAGAECSRLIGECEKLTSRLGTLADVIRNGIDIVESEQMCFGGWVIRAKMALNDSGVERQPLKCKFGDCMKPTNGPLKFWCDEHEEWLKANS
jgi:hypothetical protein